MKLWEKIKKPFIRFNEWLKGKMPGLKTKVLTAIGAIGMAAGVLQEFVSGLPLSAFLTATHVAIVSAVLFALSFWARMLTR